MPQCAMMHSESNSSAFRKHLTPSPLLKAKHQFKPRSNQRCASGELVETVREWLPRWKRSILVHSRSQVCLAIGQPRLIIPAREETTFFIMSRHPLYV